MTSTGRGGGGHGGGGRGGRGGRGGGGGGGGRGRGGRGRWRGGWRGVSWGYPSYGYYNNWWAYYAQQQRYLQYLQQVAAAYGQYPVASPQVAQLRIAIDRLTEQLQEIERALAAA